MSQSGPDGGRSTFDGWHGSMKRRDAVRQPPKHPTKAERDARKAFRQVDAQKAMTEPEIAQKAFSNNRERLKAERLAREAAGPPPSKTKAPKAKGK
jgi:hypothetical protein